MGFARDFYQFTRDGSGHVLVVARAAALLIVVLNREPMRLHRGHVGHAGAAEPQSHSETARRATAYRARSGGDLREVLACARRRGRHLEILLSALQLLSELHFRKGI